MRKFLIAASCLAIPTFAFARTQVEEVIVTATRLPAFVAAALGLALNYAAYESEIYRGALEAIPRGQLEAARTLGFTERQARFLLNVLLLRLVTAELEAAGLRVLSHSRVPPNDAGVSLGQVAVAAAKDAVR